MSGRERGGVAFPNIVRMRGKGGTSRASGVAVGGILGEEGERGRASAGVTYAVRWVVEWSGWRIYCP